MENKLNIAILGSGKGTSMVPILEAIETGALNAHVRLVVSDRDDAGILEKARTHGLQWYCVDRTGLERDAHEEKIDTLLRLFNIDVVVLVGYMRIFSKDFVTKWKGKILNVHPSLLPDFAGLMDTAVHQAVLDTGKKESGCSVHLVTETVDAGRVLVQKRCRVSQFDSVFSLKYKVQALEGNAFVDALQKLSSGDNSDRPSVDGVVPVRRALLSVFDKEGIVPLAQTLQSAGAEIISTGGTAKALRAAGISIIEISEFTHFPEIMGGRVKTLHPAVHGGILGRRDVDASIAATQGISWIDLVVCNLYPFEKVASTEGATEEDIIENIDIGGPSMIRSSAKNFAWVGVVTDVADYSDVAKQIRSHGGLTQQYRRELSAKAFVATAQYDDAIQQYFKKESEDFPERLRQTYTRAYDMRYGENPHQKAAVYTENCVSTPSLLQAEILQGKQLSYNNLLDADAAWSLVSDFSEPVCVVVKHTNPCGVAISTEIETAFRYAYEADSLSAFGGVIALNRPCTGSIAEAITSVFAEIVIAPSFSDDARMLFSKKKNLRVLALPIAQEKNVAYQYRSIRGGLLVQEYDTHELIEDELTLVTQTHPSSDALRDLLFAWRVVRQVKSNSIVLAKQGVTVGIGAGQMSRVDAAQIAIRKSGVASIGAVVASDAFFPFRDSIDAFAQAGVRAIIQPGGSLRDEDVIAACDEHGIAMVFTGVRAFKH